MTVVAVDDTDSRTEGMCTTYVGHLIATQLKDAGYKVDRTMLVRLNPAAKHKTRGNAAVAIHTNAPARVGLEVARTLVNDLSADADDMTNPAVVVSPTDDPDEEVQKFTERALTELLDIEEAVSLIESNGYLSHYLGNGRGRIGCVAAIGAWEALDDWTYECIAYRYEDVRGTERAVNYDSVSESCNEYYPRAWDTVDRVQDKPICIPNAPGPILYGIRGDFKTAVQDLAHEIDSNEPIESYETFVTNQGTDAHIVSVDSIDQMSDNTAYQVSGSVVEEPYAVEGGHVFFTIEDNTDSVQVVAFEPTKHFRDVVRSLRLEDKITVNGEFDDGTVKLEKLKIEKLNRTELVNPVCPECGNRMSSAGRNQGYRCKSCGTSQDNKKQVTVDRELESGWYEVPPCARRHIAKPLIRGGFDAEIHEFN